MKKIAIYPGSFDPITKGHEAIIKKASKIFDELFVCVGINPNKTNVAFNYDERVKLIEKVVVKFPNVKVLKYNCLTIEIAEKLQASTIVKGLRNSIDFYNELEQYVYNNNKNENIKTLLILSDGKLDNISSTEVKIKALNNESFEDDIPNEIYQEVKKRLIG